MVSDVLLGVVLQVGLPRGVDVLSVYTNRLARYESVAGATIAWQRPDESLDVQIDRLLRAAKEALVDTAPMDLRDLSAVRFGEARMVLLMRDSVCGVEGSIVGLSGNPRLGDLLRQGSGLIGALVAHAGSPADL